MIALYQDFIANLVSARTMYLRPCVKMIFKYFMPGKIAHACTNFQIGALYVLVLIYSAIVLW